MALIAMCVGGVVGKYLPVERLLWLVYKALTHSPRVLWRASAQSWDRELSDRRHWVSRDSFNIRCGKQSSKQAINQTSKQTQANSQANTKSSERTSNLARQQTREQPQLPPDAFSVCAVFGVRVFAEGKNTKDHQRTLEVLDEENISLRPTRA